MTPLTMSRADVCMCHSVSASLRVCLSVYHCISVLESVKIGLYLTTLRTQQPQREQRTQRSNLDAFWQRRSVLACVIFVRRLRQ